MSAFLARLEGRGHVTRHEPARPAISLIELTAAGRSARAAAIDRFAPLDARLQARLGSGVEPLRRQLVRLWLVLDVLRGAGA